MLRFASLSRRRRHTITAGSDGTLWPLENQTWSVDCAEEDFITPSHVGCQNRPVLTNKGKRALNSDPNLSAGKTLECPRANKCSSVCLSQTFRSPLNVSDITLPHPYCPPHPQPPRWRRRPVRSRQVSGCRGGCDASCH